MKQRVSMVSRFVRSNSGVTLPWPGWKIRYVLALAIKSTRRRHEIKQLKQKIGDLVADIEIYKEAMRGHPFSRKTLNELEK